MAGSGSRRFWHSDGRVRVTPLPLRLSVVPLALPAAMLTLLAGPVVAVGCLVVRAAHERLADRVSRRLDWA